MRNRALEIVNQIEQAFHDLIIYIQETENGEGSVKEALLSGELEELADYLYAFREMKELAEGLDSQASKRIKWLEKAICVSYMKRLETINQAPDDFENAKKMGDAAEPIRTDYCTCSPSVEYAATPPHPTKDPARYAKLMEALDMPPVMYQHELFRCHWPKMQAYLTSLLAEGKQLPEGLDHTKLFPVYKVRVNKNRKLINRATEVVERKG